MICAPLVAAYSLKRRSSRSESLTKIEKSLESPSEVPLGPFSGLRFDDLRAIVEFVRDVDREHGLGVEALDVILGDYRYKINQGTDFNVDEALWHATCEWDL